MTDKASSPLARIILNGEPTETKSTNIEQIISEFAANSPRIAAMVNGRVIRRADRPNTPVHEGDQIELITMVGGG